MSLYQKLFQITSTMDKMKKDSTNPFFKSKYFDVNQLIEAIRPELIKHDLLLLQPIESDRVISRIIDIKSGNCVEAGIKLSENVKPQDIGSEITYYRRYTLQSLLGIEAEDDDGNKAQSSHSNKKDDGKPWLGEEMKEAWQKAEDAIRKGLAQPKDLRKKYKVSRANMEYFESIKTQSINNHE